MKPGALCHYAKHGLYQIISVDDSIHIEQVYVHVKDGKQSIIHTGNFANAIESDIKVLKPYRRKQ